MQWRNVIATPQLENGHTRIANELLEQLARLHLTPNQWQVILFVMRQTYGYHRKVDKIANSKIIEGTGLCKEVVSRALKELDGRQIITRKGKVVGIQKDWEKWQKLAEQLTNVTGTKVSRIANLNPDKKLAGLLTGVDEIANKKLAEQLTQVSRIANSPATPKESIKDNKESIKRKYGEFANVLLADQEYDKLIARFGPDKTLSLIADLSLGIKSKGYKYKDHYATILNWERRDNKGTAAKGAQPLPDSKTLKEAWEQ